MLPQKSNSQEASKGSAYSVVVSAAAPDLIEFVAVTLTAVIS